MRYALGIEYDGSRFHGWQSQSGVRTVQDTLEAALSRVANQAVSVQCAGRTDTGVHAFAQVVHFDTLASREPHQWIQGCNTLLPDDICVLWACPVSDEFHARYCATSRSYRYLILNRSARPALMHARYTWVWQTLDAERMHQAAQSLLGEHDFSAYRAAGCQSATPMRHVSAVSVRRQGELLLLEITANAFLMHMVRNIAGVLIRIGRAEAEPEWAAEVLAGKDRTLGGVTAPPHGLYFLRVEYPQIFALPEVSAPDWCL